MKQALLLNTALFLATGLWAQKPPVTKVHAYARYSTAGAAPASIPGENGANIKKMSTTIANYSIFIETKKGVSVTIKKLWIEGKAYKIKKEVLSESPVLFKQQGIGNQYQTDTLVPKTANSIWKIVPNGLLEGMAPLAKNKRGNALVLEYSWKGRNYVYTAKEWKKLPPLILQ